MYLYFAMKVLCFVTSTQYLPCNASQQTLITTSGFNVCYTVNQIVDFRVSNSVRPSIVVRMSVKLGLAFYTPAKSREPWQPPDQCTNRTGQYQDKQKWMANTNVTPAAATAVTGYCEGLPLPCSEASQHSAMGWKAVGWGRRRNARSSTAGTQKMGGSRIRRAFKKACWNGQQIRVGESRNM